jgi:hypothetical protein
VDVEKNLDEVERPSKVSGEKNLFAVRKAKGIDLDEAEKAVEIDPYEVQRAQEIGLHELRKTIEIDLCEVPKGSSPLDGSYPPEHSGG